jgi:hypothetical protein
VYFSSLLGTLKAVIGGSFVKKRPTLHDHHHIEELLYGQPFQIPAQFTFVGRAISALFGVLTGLAPDFNFIEVATPYTWRSPKGPSQPCVVLIRPRGKKG